MAPSSSSSSRWCPTPEQLMFLKEMYSSGIKNPNASQIQKIAAHLSMYGKIEGKNVFYWFQNHKARDRQKLRRKLISKKLQLPQQQQLCHPHNYFHPYSCFDQYQSPSGFLSFQPLPNGCNPTSFVPQGSIVVAPGYTGKMDDPERLEMENRMMRLYGTGYGRMMMMTVDMSQASPPCGPMPPLETLELFPLTSPSLKD